MNYRTENLPPHWKEWVLKHPKLSIGHATKEMNGVVQMLWEDGSAALFNNAFVVEDETHYDLCVFTEHCGYHWYSKKGVSRVLQLAHKKTLKAHQ